MISILFKYDISAKDTFSDKAIELNSDFNKEHQIHKYQLAHLVP